MHFLRAWLKICDFEYGNHHCNMKKQVYVRSIQAQVSDRSTVYTHTEKRAILAL